MTVVMGETFPTGEPCEPQWVCAVCGCDSDLVSWPKPCGRCKSQSVVTLATFREQACERERG